MATDASATLDNKAVEAAYARWAPVYDLVFTAAMAPGRRAAVAAAEACGPHILDVGVGTGLELPMFSPSSRVVGVDLSEAMLRRARARVQRERLGQVEGLGVMDATRLAFPDGAFDVAVAPFVMSVVPDPAATLDEIARVVKPGARSSSSTTSAPKRACSRRPKASWPATAVGSAGIRSSRSPPSATGSPLAPARVSSNAAPCRPCACSHSSGSACRLRRASHRLATGLRTRPVVLANPSLTVADRPPYIPVASRDPTFPRPGAE